MGNTESGEARGAIAGLALLAAGAAAVRLSSDGHGLTGGRAAAGAISPTASSAARYLTQCTFGVTDGDILDVQTRGFDGWIAEQQAMAPTASHQAFVEAVQPPKPGKLVQGAFCGSFWAQAATAPDQLRQRMKLALSQIFVISFSDSRMDVRGAASYYDMLGASCFGNFRDLLERVTLHPMMGLFLTSVGNVKEDPATGQHPDQNYAREVMQLMSIGLYRLNTDGSYQTDGAGAPLPTYGQSDVEGLSKVLTGFGWYSPKPTAATFYALPFFNGQALDVDAPVKPMIAYPDFHSTSAKSFLGVTIPPSSTPDPLGDLKIALDTICNHPNVGPFIGAQLIKRLVTSNPSPGYVSRVSAVFNNDGAGVRGNLAAVVRAILLDPEARDDTAVSSPTFGKIREPVVRLANWMRSFGVASTSGAWLLGVTSAPTLLNQSVLDAPSVFNFWEPDYTAPGSSIAGLNLVAPEFQVVNEVSVAGYINMIQSAVLSGVGSHPPGGSAPDIQSAYLNEAPLTSDPGALVDRVGLLLLYGQMSAGLRARVVQQVGYVIATTPKHRIALAILEVMSSPEYMAQR
jgi:uncharacterized protein (DUF1800 family)